MVPSVEKKISELEMALLHLQQNIDIPEITLAMHPVVTNMIKKCQEENRKATVEDFRKMCEDSTFLNQLQNGVNRWIREIQKVSVILKMYFCYYIKYVVLPQGFPTTKTGFQGFESPRASKFAIFKVLIWTL